MKNLISTLALSLFLALPIYGCADDVNAKGDVDIDMDGEEGGMAGMGGGMAGSGGGEEEDETSCAAACDDDECAAACQEG